MLSNLAEAVQLLGFQKVWKIPLKMKKKYNYAYHIEVNISNAFLILKYIGIPKSLLRYEKIKYVSFLT